MRRSLKVSVVTLGSGLFENGARVVIGTPGKSTVGEGLGREFCLLVGYGGRDEGGSGLVGRGRFVGWEWSVGPGGGNVKKSNNDGNLKRC